MAPVAACAEPAALWLAQQLSDVPSPAGPPAASAPISPSALPAPAAEPPAPASAAPAPPPAGPQNEKERNSEHHEEIDGWKLN